MDPAFYTGGSIVASPFCCSASPGFKLQAVKQSHCTVEDSTIPCVRDYEITLTEPKKDLEHGDGLYKIADEVTDEFAGIVIGPAII